MCIKVQAFYEVQRHGIHFELLAAELHTVDDRPSFIFVQSKFTVEVGLASHFSFLATDLFHCCTAIAGLLATYPRSVSLHNAEYIHIYYSNT